MIPQDEKIIDRDLEIEKRKAYLFRKMKYLPCWGLPFEVYKKYLYEKHRMKA